MNNADGLFGEYLFKECNSLLQKKFHVESSKDLFSSDLGLHPGL